MADAANIGEIQVLINGDWTDLQSALDAAAAASTAGAQEIAAAFQPATAGMDEMGAAATTVAPEIQAAGDAAAAATSPIHDAGEAAHEGAGGLGEFGHSLSEMAEMAGLVVGLEQAVDMLKEFVSESIDAASKVQFLTVALTSLTGSAEAANEIIETAADISRNTTSAFVDLAQAGQQMAAFGMGADAIKVALEGMADWAEVSGKSLGSLESALERVYLTGDINTRTLKTLGLTLQDLADVMGVSADQVKNAIKGMGAQSDETMEAIALAMKEKGEKAANDLAATHEVAANRLKTAWHEFAVFLGNEFLPGLDKVSYALEHMLAGAAATITFMGELANPVKATTDAINEYAKMLGISTDASNKSGQSQQDMAEQIKKAAAAGLANVAAQNQQVEATQKLHDHTVNFSTEIGRLITEYDTAARSSQAFTQYLNQNASALAQQGVDAAAVKKSFDALAGENLEPLYQQLIKLRDNMIAAGETGTFGFKQVQAAVVDLGQQLITSGAFTDELTAKINQSAQQGIDGFQKIAAAINQVPPAVDAVTAKMLQLTDAAAKNTAEYLHTRDALLDLMQIGELTGDALDAAMKKLIDSAKQAGVDVSQLTLAIVEMGQAGTLTGDQVTAALKAIADATNTNITATDNLKTHGVDMAKQIGDAIGRDLSKALSDLIFQTGKLGDAFKKLGQDVVDIILNDIIKRGIQVLESKLSELGGMFSSVFGASGGAAGGAASGASGAASGAGGIASGVGGAVSGVMGMVGAIGSAVGAVSGIISNFQMAHQTDILKSIELNTRLTAAFIGGLGGGGITDWLEKIAINTSHLIGFDTWYHDWAVNVGGDLDTIKGSFKGGATTIGTVNINISGAQSPQQTAQAVAQALKNVSPVFSP